MVRFHSLYYDLDLNNSNFIPEMLVKISKVKDLEFLIEFEDDCEEKRVQILQYCDELSTDMSSLHSKLSNFMAQYSKVGF